MARGKKRLWASLAKSLRLTACTMIFAFLIGLLIHRLFGMPMMTPLGFLIAGILFTTAMSVWEQTSRAV